MAPVFRLSSGRFRAAAGHYGGVLSLLTVLAGDLPPSIPTHDSDVWLYAIGGVVLLVLGGFLIRYANRNKP